MKVSSAERFIFGSATSTIIGHRSCCFKGGVLREVITPLKSLPTDLVTQKNFVIALRIIHEFTEVFEFSAY